MVRRAPGASEARVYDISGRRPTPLQANLTIGAPSTTALKRARRKLELQNTDTDLIQDFAFPTVSQRIKVSPDGRYIFASGTYPPQIHVYDTEELSLKFKRHVSNEIIDFQILEQDWRKFALLSADRYIDLHSPMGSHFRTRVPRFGRDLMLHRGTCDLFVCGDGRDVWRLNIEQGRFLAPIPTTSGRNGGNNVCGISPTNCLLAFGGENCLVDVWDSRTVGHAQQPAGTLNIAQALRQHSPRAQVENMEISAIRFDESDGVTMAVGTTTGHTLMFDIRSPNALRVRDQGNGLPIRSIRLHEDSKHVITADPRSVKVWERATGENMVAIEPDSDINHLCVIGNSGVMCTALESQRVKTYYVPALGPAPKWCAFLDSFTEELESGKKLGGATGMGSDGEEEVYENYKFVAHDELEGLGLGHLIGTDMLKAYMHGYFVHQKLYKRAVDVAEPFAYEKYRKEKAREKLEAQRQSRITKVKSRSKKVKVNQQVADALKHTKNPRKAATAKSILEDDRFTAMFSNRDYTVKEDADRFQFLNPSGIQASRRKQEDSDSDEEYLEQFDLVDDGGQSKRDGEDPKEHVWSSDDSEDDDDSIEGSDEVEGGSEVAANSGIRSSKRVSSKHPKMYEIGKVGEMIGHRGLEAKDGKGALRRKIREEVALGVRVSGTGTGHDRRAERSSEKRRKSSRRKG